MSQLSSEAIMNTRSKEEFVRKYKRLYHGKTEAEKFYLLILTKLQKAISESHIDNFKRLSNFLDYISDIENQMTLRNYYDNPNNPLKNTNLIILACKHDNVKILEYLLDNDSKILNNLSTRVKKPILLPHDADEVGHNAFYYAIRLGNVELLDILISKWPNNYFANHLQELDKILSIVYEELNLKNVLLSEQIEIFVEKKLINLRFFCSTSKQEKGSKSNLTIDDIKSRLELILQKINLLKADYLNAKKVDERFLFTVKFIARNIHVLKRQLKSTYDILPWEEMEFCLVSFVSSHVKRQEINLFYYATLNKGKILNHLENFAERLKDVKNNTKSRIISQFAHLPKLKREKVIAEIISNCPQFEELYNDYQEISDIYSLQKMSDYIQLALSSDPKEGEGQLIITRALQVIGEYLKNSLESPKLSNTISEHLLLSLPKNTRKVIINLRDSLSHAFSLSKRIEIEENMETKFFIGVQNDIKKVGDVITNILANKKIKTIKILLEKIIQSKNLDDIKEVAIVVSNVRFDKIIDPKFKTMEHKKLKKLVQKLCDNITDKTDYQTNLFNKMDNIINYADTESENIKTEYNTGLAVLMSLNTVLTNLLINNNVDDNVIRVTKYVTNKTLEIIRPQIKTHNLKEITELLWKIFKSITNTQQDDEVARILYEICYLTEFEINNIKSIQSFREKLHKKGSTSVHKQQTDYNVTIAKYNNQLEIKLSELNSILSNNGLSDQLIEKFASYKRNTKLQAVIEMLVLDIFSIVDIQKNYMENNLLLLDDNAPLLTGKYLRNHLAHGNALVDILLFDPSVAVLLNAQKFAEKNIMEGKRKIGKLVENNPFKLKDKYDEDLIIITNQANMFIALQEGNLERLKHCLKKGADIKARSLNLWTALHFAAKGPSLEVVKLIFDENLDTNAKDINGQNPLHIAVAHGRKSIVEFFLREVNLYVDDVDYSGKTPLHIAAINGDKETADILLKFKANTNIGDNIGFLPLHYAIKNNYIHVVKILLKKEVNADIYETTGGFTSLHIAAENGHLDMVNFLLSNQVNVNARNYTEGIPLHTAALNGHLEVVNALILKGANVNAKVLDGCTPLHYAVENGHEKIASILLRYGADVNAFDKTYHNTPLHYATNDGHHGIVKTLLRNNANINVATVEGITPLHLAVLSGHLEIVNTLLKYDANIYAKDKWNTTPLHYAAKNGHKQIVELFMNRAINYGQINARTISNFTPLHMAAHGGHQDVIDLLIKNKAEVNTQDAEGKTPLHLAAMHGNKDIIDILIKNKAEVNAETNTGCTPLHMAVQYGHEDVTISLINFKAEINSTADCNLTPLHGAIMAGQKNIVNFLIKNKASVNVGSIAGPTPLLLAVEVGDKEIVEILIANGANVNATSQGNMTPLLSAIRHNFKEMVDILIANGANVNGEGNEGLPIAVLYGFEDIVEVLLRNNACVNMKNPTTKITPLHVAAKQGSKKIVNALIMRGADINATTMDNLTPLHIAAHGGYEEIVEILIANAANINIPSKNGDTPLHLTVTKGHYNVVKVLLKYKVDVNIKDDKNRTPLELAVAHGHLQVVQMLLQYKKVDMNTKGNDNWTLLHIASQTSNLEMVKHLLNEGADIYAENISGSKPIHIAAREGHEDIVKFFLNKGLSINEPGAVNQTLLHYAAINGQLEVVEYLITQGADVNAKDANGLTPMHISATFGHKNIIEVLLKNGSIYNAVDKFDRKPLKMAADKTIINLLSSTDKLFEAVKHKSYSEIENCIKAGAIVNVKNSANATPLHYAAWKGHDGAVSILLQNKANPNAVDSKGLTPLHYAVKFLHLNIVKILLSNGAIYNALSNNGKIPSDFTTDESLTSLFKLVSESFRNIEKGNIKVIDELNSINNIGIVKAVMGARNRKNKTLVVVAVHNNFSKIKQLKEISQGDVSMQINAALVFASQGDYVKALGIFTSILEKRKKVLGPDNPGTLDVQKHVAIMLYKQGAYHAALTMLEEIFQKQKEMLGLSNRDTLSSRSAIALVLHRQRKDEEAYNIYQEVYQKQKEILGVHDSDTLNTQFHMALVLDRQGKYEEALNINKAIFENRKRTLGRNDPATISAQNNIAMVLANQTKHEEALRIYEEVFQKKKVILGIHHTDTLRTLQSIAGIYQKQKKYNEALKTYEDVLEIQKKVLRENHPETLNTQHNLANMHFQRGKWICALKAYKEVLDPSKAVFGPSHPIVMHISKKLEVISLRFKLQGYKISEILEYLQKDINIAASDGNIETVQRLLKDGADVNDKDIDGRTPLHYAVSSRQISTVNILIKSGADVTQVTNKGNTPLHTATSKNCNEIVELLLQHTHRDKLNEFINAKTVSGGTAALHVAAKGGSLEVVKSLLKYGTIYNIENKEGKTPIDLSGDPEIINLLMLVEELYQDARNGNLEIISKLKALKPDEFIAVTSARNNHGNTLLQVAIVNKHKNIVSKLLELLKKSEADGEHLQ